MTKLKTDPIGQSDLIEFLNNHSDFSFEIQVLNALSGVGFNCEHGGTYDDPATGKPRQFDIRATKQFGKRFLRLAVECKNLRPNFPLIISCLPRREEESFHYISLSVNPETNPLEQPEWPFAMLPQSKSVRVTSQHGIYKPGEPVGKSCDQVGRDPNGSITSSDSDIYDKWAQALSSAHDLTYLACSDGKERTGDVALSLVFAVLVVPNGHLWITEYDSDGKRITDPKTTDHCSYFVNRSYFHQSSFAGDEFNLSHLEFVTLAGLLDFVDALCGDSDRVDKTFPLEEDNIFETVRRFV